MTGAATTAALPPLVQAKFDPYLLAGLQSQFAHYDDRADGGDAPLISVGFTLVLPASAAIAQATSPRRARIDAMPSTSAAGPAI